VWHQVKITTAGSELMEQMCHPTSLKTKKQPQQGSGAEDLCWDAILNMTCCHRRLAADSMIPGDGKTTWHF